MTHMPYVFVKKRSTRRSLSTPFCMQTTAVSGGATPSAGSRAPSVVLTLHGQEHDPADVSHAFP